jgi:chemotaxis protein MotA
MDLATVIGLIVGFLLVAAAIILGGSVGAFIDVPSILIVIGGTFFITMVNFSLAEVIRAQKLLVKTMVSKPVDPSKAAMQVVELADQARRKGVLGLQQTLAQLQGEPFLHKALSMVVDGIPVEDVERILKRDISQMAYRHMQSAQILKRSAEVAPAMGLIGTLVGLVQMLGNLEDPSTIGPAMAVALLTTFYGAVLANMVFNPLAGKLERNSMEEQMFKQIFLAGATSIGRQENPRRLELTLNAMLPPAKRIQFYD